MFCLVCDLLEIIVIGYSTKYIYNQDNHLTQKQRYRRRIGVSLHIVSRLRDLSLLAVSVTDSWWEFTLMEFRKIL